MGEIIAVEPPTSDLGTVTSVVHKLREVCLPYTAKPVAQSDQTKSPARFSRKREYCRRCAEISGSAAEGHIKLGT